MTIKEAWNKHSAHGCFSYAEEAELIHMAENNFRAGVEAMRDELHGVWPEDSRFSRSIRTVIGQAANKLLTEGEKE